MSGVRERVALIALVWSVGCGGGASPPAADVAPAAPAPAAAPAPRPPAPQAPLRPLTDDELTRCIAVLAEVRAQADRPPGTPSAYGEILQRHGFDHATFTEVQQNVGRAYGAVVYLDAPTPAGTPRTLPESYGAIPPENIELLRARRAEFEAVARKPAP